MNIAEKPETVSVRDKMLKDMSVSWDQIDTFINNIEGSGRADTFGAWGQDWLANKRHIFMAWGEKLRIEKEVELSLSERDVRSEMRAMIGRLRDTGKVSEISLGIVSIALYYLSYEDILENKLADKTVLFNITFGAGMKVSKMLGRLISDDKEKYEVQTAFSLSVQSFKASGMLVMSIDPIDILCMSLNPNSEWRSCHNIADGEFRAGAVSYVTDKSSFIAYVYRRTGESNYLPGVEIPNKLWRQMGYFSDNLDFIALSTHYPSTNKNNRKTLVSLVEEVMGNGSSIHGFVDTDALEHNDVMVNHNRLHYNDLTQGRSNRAYMVDLKGAAGSKDELEEFFGSYDSGTLFNVGEEEVSTFYNSGTINDAGCLDSSYEDDDDYDDDWDED